MADRGSVDGMLFAAGLGTRLRPLTNDIPKALVPVGGVPMLERVARRLIDAGADRIVVNVHHHAERVMDYIHSRDDFGVEIRISLEDAEPLETGGGLKRAHAQGFFRGDRPIVIHNSDVLTDFPLRDMMAAHAHTGALATLAVMDRDKSRALVFDDDGLCGLVDREGVTKWAREAPGRTRHVGFCGVHVVSAELPSLLAESGVFSIMWPYMRLAAEGERIAPWDADGWTWIDIGSHEKLAQAEALVAAGHAPAAPRP